jgi:hypothetical protein
MSNENRATTVWTRQQANVTNVVASGRGSNILSGIANNLHCLYFHARAAGGAALTRAQLITDIGSIQIRVGTELVVNATTTTLLDLYKYYYDCYGALAAPLGVIPVPFVRPHMPVWDIGRAFALGMKRNADPNDPNLNTVAYTVVFNAGLVTAATVEVYVAHDLYDPEPAGLHIRTLEITRSNTATGVERITDFPRVQVGVLAYHIAVGTCTNITVIKNGGIVMDNIHADIAALQQDQAMRTPQALYTHIDFAAVRGGGDLNAYERLGPNVVEWDVRPTWTVAPGAGYTVVCEEVHDGIGGA